MRTLNSFLLGALSVFSACVFFQVAAARAQNDSKTDALTFTATVVSQEYCAHRPSHETKNPRGLTGEVSFHVHLKIRNVSTHPVILCEACIYLEPPEVFYVTAAGSPGELRWSPDTDDRVEPSKALRFPDHPDSRFRVMQPGDSFETDRATPPFLPVGEAWSEGAMRWIAPGPYFLRVSFRPWDQSPQITDALRRRWKAYGELHSENLVSSPVAVRLEIPPDSPSCPDY